MKLLAATPFLEANQLAAASLIVSLPAAASCGGVAPRAASSLPLPQLHSVLTCPQCGHVNAEIMPTDACVYFHKCAGCRAILKPRAGDCCVFCSYGSVPGPPIQAGGACC